MASLIKSLKIGSSSTQYDLEDWRVVTSANDVSDANWKSASGGSTAAASGDIYLRTGMPTYQTSNGWSYITRPDGITECWKVINLGSVGMNSWWGNVCYNDAPIPSAQLTYPVTFASRPCVFRYMQSDSYNFWWYCYNMGSTTAAPNLGLARANSAGTATGVKIYYHVIGKV